jgi:hypothetical protein
MRGCRSTTCSGCRFWGLGQVLVPLLFLNKARRGPAALFPRFDGSSPGVMSSVTGITLFLALIVFSLVVVSFANRIQTRNRLMVHKVHQMRRRIDELEEICAGIEPLLESVFIPRLIIEEILDLARSIKQVDPGASFVEQKLEHAQTLAQALDAGHRSQPFYRAQPSDAAIAKHKHHLTEAARVVRRHQALGRLQTDEMDAYIRELAWTRLMVDVISYMTQGHKAVTREDPVVAYGYYRRAQNLLMSSQLSDDRRHRLIREISEVLAGKRLALSTDLMPESDFNPTAKPEFAQAAAQELNKLKPVAGA